MWLEKVRREKVIRVAFRFTVPTGGEIDESEYNNTACCMKRM